MTLRIYGHQTPVTPPEKWTVTRAACFEFPGRGMMARIEWVADSDPVAWEVGCLPEWFGQRGFIVDGRARMVAVPLPARSQDCRFRVRPILDPFARKIGRWSPRVAPS